MNLAFVAKRYDTNGGTERNLYELTRRLPARGHDVHVYCLDPRIAPAEGVRIHRLAAWGGGRTGRLWALAVRGPARAFRGGHDVVISYARVLRQDLVRCGGGVHREYLRRLAARESAGRRLLRAADPYHRSLLAIERAQFRPDRYRRIVAVSETVKQELVQAFGVPPEAITRVYNGVDADRFRPAASEAERRGIRAQWGLSPEAPLLLFVGNAFRRKGLDALLDAVAALAPEGAQAVVVGEDPDGEAYRRRAAQRGLGDRVRFAGRQDEPRPFYQAADALVLPALQEAFGIVVLEAMACGLPVVLARPAGAAEVIPAGLRAYLLDDPADPAELAGRIRALLAAGNRDALRRETRRAAEAHSLDAHADRMEEEIRRVWEMKKSARP